tara:strand:+ start:286 stop:930 length:645 start_codon:yes stop_codon:yes gene_type:complete
MSIATLKKNAESRYFNKVSSQNTFSLNGTRRNQGYVGQHNLMRSLKRTPYSRYGGPVNQGTKGNFVQNIHNSGSCSSNDDTVIKKSTKSNRAMIFSKHKWINRGYPHAVVQPDCNFGENSSQSLYIYQKANDNLCVKDQDKEHKEKQCDSKDLTYTRIGGRLICQNVYAKTLSISKDQGTHIREIQKNCVKQEDIYPPKLNGDGFRGCKGCGGD